MVSVIIINHNYAQYLPDAIESVLNQTSQDYEIIIIDGASNDASRDVIYRYVKKYPDKITAVFKPTSGQAAAFNMGIKISRGDIIAFLDADDYFAKDKIKTITKYHKDYNFIGTSRYVDSGEKICKVYADHDDNYEKWKDLLKKYGYIYTYNLITSCISMTRLLAKKIFPMPENEYITFADCYVKVYAQYLDGIKYIDEPLTYYRNHSKQAIEIIDNNTNFISNLYMQTFRDINLNLKRHKMPLIPKLTKDNFKMIFFAENNFSPNTDKYVMYGTGIMSHTYAKWIEFIGGGFLYAIDTDPDKWGGQWRGVPILSPEDGIKRFCNDMTMIIGSNNYREEIRNILIRRGLNENEDFWVMKFLPND